MHSSIPSSTSNRNASISFQTRYVSPLAHLELHIRHSSFPDGAPRFPPNSSYLPFKPHFDSPLVNLNSNLLDITNRAKRRWNSISPTRQAGSIRKNKECLPLLCAMDELCVSAFVGPDEMGDFVDDIETMFDSILIAESG